MDADFSAAIASEWKGAKIKCALCLLTYHERCCAEYLDADSFDGDLLPDLNEITFSACFDIDRDEAQFMFCPLCRRHCRHKFS